MHDDSIISHRRISSEHHNADQTCSFPFVKYTTLSCGKKWYNLDMLVFFLRRRDDDGGGDGGICFFKLFLSLGDSFLQRLLLCPRKLEVFSALKVYSGPRKRVAPGEENRNRHKMKNHF